MPLKIEESFRCICYDYKSIHNGVADESPRLDVTHGTHLVAHQKSLNFLVASTHEVSLYKIPLFSFIINRGHLDIWGDGLSAQT